MNHLPDIDHSALDDAGLLERFQRSAFNYFLETVNPDNGLVADTNRADAPSSIAVVGFALSCYPIAVERGWITRALAVDLTLAALRFFRASRQGIECDATGYRGFYYHFLDMRTGARTWQCELSMVDTAFLMAGMLTASAYFERDLAADAEIREHADALYQRVDWRWALGRKATLRQGWKPKCRFLRYRWEGYSEATLLYVLAAASSDHAIPRESYEAWTSTYRWQSIYGYDVLYGGPLFMHQFSHAWIDFEGIRDPFMREKKSDYFENSRRATLIHREYARRNPREYDGYGDDLWGLSASDGPGNFRTRKRGRRLKFRGYTARGAPFGPDDGTIAPWSCLGSLPFAPDVALSALRHVCNRFPTVVDGWRMPSAFNPTLANRKSFGSAGWISAGNYGLDQGIVVMMIENYRSRMIWDLMRKSPILRQGLRRTGFAGGWLG